MCLSGSAQHGYRVPALLADLEILGIIHRTAGIGTPIVGNDFVFITENIRNGCIKIPIAATRRDH